MKVKILWRVVLGGYLLWLVFYVALRITEGGYPPRTYHHNFNLIPFKTVGQYLFHFSASDTTLKQLLAPFLVYLPLGFLLPASGLSTSLKRTLLWSLLAALLIEALQFATKLGVFDIDDVWRGLLGASLGYALWQMVGFWRSKAKPATN